MTERSIKENDSLDDFAHREITLNGSSKLVHVAGTGPAVIVMTEMPGISPHVARFGSPYGVHADIGANIEEHFARLKAADPFDRIGFLGKQRVDPPLRKHVRGGIDNFSRARVEDSVRRQFFVLL